MNSDKRKSAKPDDSIGDERSDDLRRKTYLRSKGVKPTDQFQLDLIFPETIGKRDDLRHMPNDYGRSSLFAAKSKKEPRKTLVRQKLFHYNQHVSILYTGVELRAEDDELCWLQILNYGRDTPLGQPFEFAIKDLVRDVGWSKSGANYERARMCISRLKANEILAMNTKAYGKSGSMSLIQNYATDNDDEGKASRYKVWIDPNMMVLFAGNNFTSHKWEVYITLSPVARRLADYIESHKTPFPLALDTFRLMCGSSDNSKDSWKQTVRKACKEVQDKGVVNAAVIPRNEWRINFVQEKSEDTLTRSNDTENPDSTPDV